MKTQIFKALRRPLALLLAFTLVLGIASISAYAEDDGSGGSVTEGTSGGDVTTGDGSTGDGTTGDGTTGDGATGDVITGDVITGDVITGDITTGDGTTGGGSEGTVEVETKVGTFGFMQASLPRVGFVVSDSNGGLSWVITEHGSFSSPNYTNKNEGVKTLAPGVTVYYNASDDSYYVEVKDGAPAGQFTVLVHFKNDGYGSTEDYQIVFTVSGEEPGIFRLCNNTDFGNAKIGDFVPAHVHDWDYTVVKQVKKQSAGDEEYDTSVSIVLGETVTFKVGVTAECKNSNCNYNSTTLELNFNDPYAPSINGTKILLNKDDSVYKWSDTYEFTPTKTEQITNTAIVNDGKGGEDSGSAIVYVTDEHQHDWTYKLTKKVRLDGEKDSKYRDSISDVKEGTKVWFKVTVTASCTDNCELKGISLDRAFFDDEAEKLGISGFKNGVRGIKLSPDRSNKKQLKGEVEYSVKAYGDITNTATLIIDGEQVEDVYDYAEVKVKQKQPKGTIKITKNIVDSEGKIVENADDTFKFVVYKYDDASRQEKVAVVRITTKNGVGKESTRELPYGTYKVVEVGANDYDTLYFVGDTETDEISLNGKKADILVKNTAKPGKPDDHKHTWKYSLTKLVSESAEGDYDEGVTVDKDSPAYFKVIVKAECSDENCEGIANDETLELAIQDDKAKGLTNFGFDEDGIKSVTLELVEGGYLEAEVAYTLTAGESFTNTAILLDKEEEPIVEGDTPVTGEANVHVHDWKYTVTKTVCLTPDGEYTPSVNAEIGDTAYFRIDVNAECRGEGDCDFAEEELTLDFFDTHYDGITNVVLTRNEEGIYISETIEYSILVEETINNIAEVSDKNSSGNDEALVIQGPAGTLNLIKVVSGNNNLADENEFYFVITSTDGKGYEFKRTVTVDKSGNGSNTIVLPVGEYEIKEVGDGVAGFGYTVAYKYGDDVDAKSIEIVEDAEAVITVTNTLKTGGGGTIIVNPTTPGGGGPGGGASLGTSPVTIASETTPLGSLLNPSVLPDTVEDVTITDEEMPLGVPEIVVEDEVTIVEESVPLGGLPQTGVNDITLLWILGLFVSLLLMTSTIMLTIRRKKVC